jgi:hypothetical protein
MHFSEAVPCWQRSECRFEPRPLSEAIEGLRYCSMQVELAYSQMPSHDWLSTLE